MARRVVGAIALGVAAAVAVLASSAAADEWAPAAITQPGELYEIDLSTISVAGPVVKSWMRDTPRRPLKDAASGKTYVTTVAQRSDDCEHRRFALGSYFRKDAKGQVVGTGAVNLGWSDITPGSIAEVLWSTACRAARPPAEKPILADITQGDWVRLGVSADKSYALSMRMDNIVMMDDRHAVVAIRSESTGYRTIQGYPIKYTVQEIVVDCMAQTSAVYRTDQYMSASIRAVSITSPKLDFEPGAPGSFMANAFQQVCAAAKPAKPKPPPEEAEAGSLVSGTAWGANKGYLVTASHVVKGWKEIDVFSDGEPMGKAEVVADDPANDLAVLRLRHAAPAKLPVLPISERPATLGRSVFTLGYPAPDALGAHIKMTAGEVSSTSGLQDDARLLQVSVPIQAGNSGGPVIAWDGTVLGVIGSTLETVDEDRTDPAQLVNYAVKVSYVKPMLDDLPDLGNYIVVRVAGSHDEVIAAARKAVFMLLVTR